MTRDLEDRLLHRNFSRLFTGASLALAGLFLYPYPLPRPLPKSAEASPEILEK
jgi:hypothetical protein